MFKDGWLFEPLTKSKQPLWIYGAGHVGTAIVQILSQLEQFSITCIDTSNDRYPTNFPNNVDKLITAQPAHVVKYAPPKTHHLILTYSHALDLEICNQLRETANTCSRASTEAKTNRTWTSLQYKSG